MDNSHNVWQKIASMSKPPLPPITPTGNTLIMIIAMLVELSQALRPVRLKNRYLKRIVCLN